MRLSELLKLDANDRRGRHVGHVRDVRLEKRGDRWEIAAVILGNAAVAERLGFAYRAVDRPYLLAKLMQWLTRHARAAPWDVVEIRDGRISLDADHEDLPHPGEHGT
jgi:hypothetical protein